MSLDLDDTLFDPNDPGLEGNAVIGHSNSSSRDVAAGDQHQQALVSSSSSHAVDDPPSLLTLVAPKNFEIDPEVASANAVIHSQITEAQRTILSTVEFSDMRTASETGSADDDSTAIRAAYQEAKAIASLKKHSKYSTGLNLFKVDPLSNPLKGAPVVKYKLDWLVNNMFAKAFDDIPYTITVGLTTGMSPSSAFGSLILISLVNCSGLLSWPLHGSWH